MDKVDELFGAPPGHRQRWPRRCLPNLAMAAGILLVVSLFLSSLGPHSPILTSQVMQNGLGNEQSLASLIPLLNPKELLAPMTVTVISTVTVQATPEVSTVTATQTAMMMITATQTVPAATVTVPVDDAELVLRDTRTYVNIVLCYRNRLERLVKFLFHLSRIVEDYGDTHFRVILSDYNSSPEVEKSTGSLLKEWTFETGISAKHIIVPVVGDRSKAGFNRALSLHSGLEAVEDNNEIVFLCDVDMYLPLHVFDAIRNNTAMGRTFYVPICFSLYEKGNELFYRTPIKRAGIKTRQTGYLGGRQDEMNKIGYWRVWGQGMVAVYKKDYAAAGNPFGKYLNQTTWGDEDLQLADSFARIGLKKVRKQMFGFYHMWHPKALWEASPDGIDGPFNERGREYGL